MPYIKQEERRRIETGSPESPISTLGRRCRTPGELNYALTSICLEYLDNGPLKYADYNEVIGVLTCVIQELYRREVSRYEDEKSVINGDVY